MRACAGCKVGRGPRCANLTGRCANLIVQCANLMLKCSNAQDLSRELRGQWKCQSATPLSSINLTSSSFKICWQTSCRVCGLGEEVLRACLSSQEFLIYSFNAAHCRLNGSSKVLRGGEKGPLLLMTAWKWH